MPTIPGRAQHTPRDQRTWLAAPPQRCRDTALHSRPGSSCPVQDPDGPGPAHLCPAAKGLEGSRAVLCSHPGPVPRREAGAGSAWTACRGALVCSSVLCINPHLETTQRNPAAQPSPEAGHKHTATESCRTSSCCQQLQAMWAPFREHCPQILFLPRTALPTACRGEVQSLQMIIQSSTCRLSAQEAVNYLSSLQLLLHAPMAHGRRDAPSVLPARDSSQVQGWCWL